MYTRERKGIDYREYNRVMAHLNEFCSPSCLFDSTNENEMKYACSMCWANEVVPIVPALAATIWGKDGLVVGQYKDTYFVKEQMSNGEWSRGTVHKSKVKFK